MGNAKRIDTELVVRVAPDHVTQALAALRPGAQWLITAYLHFERLHGAPAGHPGVCWPTNTEVAAHLGRTVASVRKSRDALVRARLVALKLVRPLGRLPNGQISPNGTNVVILMQGGGPGEAMLAANIVDAAIRLHGIQAARGSVGPKARRRVEALRARLWDLREGIADNDESVPYPSSHKAPSTLPLPSRFAPRKTGKPSTPPPARRRRVA